MPPSSVEQGIRLEGMALHAGVRTAVTFRPHQGPLMLAQGGSVHELTRLSVTRTDAGVELTGPSLRVDLVEHALSAVAGLGIRAGLVLEVEGPELPLLDGGAKTFTEALDKLELPRSPPPLAVAREAVLTAGETRYSFEPGDDVELDVRVRFDHPRIGAQRARWSGDAADYRARIAPARTFGFARDAARLKAAKRAQLAATSLDAVVIYTDDGVLPGPRLPDPDEAARHKLLDLIGDFAVYGGPPRGRVVADKPGHHATHIVVARALAQGILTRS